MMLYGSSARSVVLLSRAARRIEPVKGDALFIDGSNNSYAVVLPCRKAALSCKRWLAS